MAEEDEDDHASIITSDSDSDIEHHFEIVTPHGRAFPPEDSVFHHSGILAIPPFNDSDASSPPSPTHSSPYVVMSEVSEPGASTSSFSSVGEATSPLQLGDATSIEEEEPGREVDEDALTGTLATLEIETPHLTSNPPSVAGFIPTSPNPDVLSPSPFIPSSSLNHYLPPPATTPRPYTAHTSDLDVSPAVNFARRDSLSRLSGFPSPLASSAHGIAIQIRETRTRVVSDDGSVVPPGRASYEGPSRVRPLEAVSEGLEPGARAPVGGRARSGSLGAALSRRLGSAVRMLSVSAGGAASRSRSGSLSSNAPSTFADGDRPRLSLTSNRPETPFERPGSAAGPSRLGYGAIQLQVEVDVVNNCEGDALSEHGSHFVTDPSCSSNSSTADLYTYAHRPASPVVLFSSREAVAHSPSHSATFDPTAPSPSTPTFMTITVERHPSPLEKIMRRVSSSFRNGSPSPQSRSFTSPNIVMSSTRVVATTADDVEDAEMAPEDAEECASPAPTPEGSVRESVEIVGGGVFVMDERLLTLHENRTKAEKRKSMYAVVPEQIEVLDKVKDDRKRWST